jgi:hypothetical protein
MPKATMPGGRTPTMGQIVKQLQKLEKQYSKNVPATRSPKNPPKKG